MVKAFVTMTQTISRQVVIDNINEKSVFDVQEEALKLWVDDERPHTASTPKVSRIEPFDA